MNLRIYASHITLFPLTLIFLLMIHAYLVHAYSFSPTPHDAWADQPSIPSSEMKGKFNEHLGYILVYAMLYYGGLALLAFFVRAPLQGPPVSDHGPLKPPWPFLWMYGFENRWGVISVLFASMALFGMLAAVPLIDCGRDRRFRARKTILALGALLALTVMGLTLHGYITPAKIHLHKHGGEESHTDNKHSSDAHDSAEPPHNDAEQSPVPSPSHDEKPHSHGEGSVTK